MSMTKHWLEIDHLLAWKFVYCLTTTNNQELGHQSKVFNSLLVIGLPGSDHKD